MRNGNKDTVLAIGIVFVASFLAVCVLYEQIIAINGPMFSSVLDDRVPMVLFSGAAAACVAVCSAFFFFGVSLPVLFVRGAYVLYALVLCYVLFGKSAGVSGVSLAPSLSELCSPGLALNVLMFVPAGVLAWLRTKRLGLVLAMGLVGSLLVEGAQLALSLGIADVLDVAANTAGMLLGGAFVCVLEKFGLRVNVEGKSVRLVQKA